MKVHDCILFSNEIDLLYLRLSELDAVVDQFLIVQGTTTFQGAERTVVSLEDDDRLKPFAPKIRHVVVDDLPRGTTPWFAEYAQRNRLGEAAREQASPDDLLLFSDVDEIPSRKAVERAHLIERGQVGAFNMRFFYYGLNWEFPARWDRGRAVRADALRHVSAQELRSCPPDIVIREPAWHLSYFYRRNELLEQIKKKATSFAHSEYARRKYLKASYLDFCIRGGISWCTSPRYLVKFRFHSVDEGYPEQIKAERASWREFCIAENERDHAAEAEAWLLSIGASSWKGSERARKFLLRER